MPRVGPITYVGDHELALSPDGQLHDIGPILAPLRGWPTLLVLATPEGRAGFTEEKPELDARQVEQLRELGVAPIGWVPEGHERDHASPLVGEVYGDASPELLATTIAMGAQSYGLADFMETAGLVIVRGREWEVFIVWDDEADEYTVVLTPRD